MSEPGKSILGEVFRRELKEVLREVLTELLPSAGKGDALMDVKKVAKYLHQSPDWVYRHWRQIGGRKIGAKSIRFYRSDVDRWLKTRKTS